MKTGRLLLLALGIYAVTAAGCVGLIELGKRYGDGRVLADYATVLTWLVGCGLSALACYWATRIVRWVYRRRHPNPPEKPWVEQQ